MALSIIPATTGVAFLLQKGDQLKIVDVEGGQTGDLMAYRCGVDDDPLCNGRTFDYGRKVAADTTEYLSVEHTRRMLSRLFPRAGDRLYSNRRNGHGRPRPRQNAAQVKHLDPVERSRRYSKLSF